MRKTTIRLLVGIVMLLGSLSILSVQAQARSDKVTLYFRIGSASYDIGYRNNNYKVKKLERLFLSDTTLKIKRIVVVGGTSPEGGDMGNLRLARSRAQNVLNMLKRSYSWLFVDNRLPSEVKIQLTNSSNNWQDIEDLRYATVYVHYDDQIEQKPSVVAPEPVAEAIAISPLGTVRPLATVEPLGTVEQLATVEPMLKEHLTDPMQPIQMVVERKPLFALKTNLIFDLVAALNLEVEIPLGRQWSVAVEGIFPWWLWDNRRICMQLLSGHIEGRYWFDRRKDRPLLTGWFMGLYGGYGYYDLGYNAHGTQGEFCNVGISGGYGHQIGKNLSLEYSIGLGYLRSNCRTYEAHLNQTNDWVLSHRKEYKLDWLGPTRFKVSLVWMLNGKNR